MPRRVFAIGMYQDVLKRSPYKWAIRARFYLVAKTLIFERLKKIGQLIVILPDEMVVFHSHFFDVPKLTRLCEFF